jgi:hypothetical protein
MKPTDLEKHLGKKIEERMRREPIPERYGAASSSASDKKAQRERDKAAGLVPFAVKLPQELVTSLQQLAQQRGVPLGDLVAELLRSGVSAETSAPAKR